MLVWLVFAGCEIPLKSSAQTLPETHAGVKDVRENKAEFINLAKPLKPCWAVFDQRIETDKIASDNGDGYKKDKTNSSIFIPSKEGVLSSLETDTATKNWEAELGGRIVANILTADKNVYVLSKSVRQKKLRIEEFDPNSKKRLTLRSLYKNSGLTEWQTEVNLPEFKDSANEVQPDKQPELKKEELKEEETNSKMILFDSSIIVITSESVFSISRLNGSLQWNQNYGALLPTQSILSDNLLILASSKGFFVLSANDGNFVEFVGTSNATAVLYQSDKSRIIFGNNKGSVSAVSLKTKAKSFSKSKTKKNEWQIRNGAEVADISLTTQGILISSLDNFLYLLTEKDGEIIWKKRINGRIASPPLVEGNLAVVTVVSESTASVIDLATGKTINKIALENNDFFSGKPLLIKDRLLLFTQRGIFAFAGSDCRQSNSDV